MVNRDKDFVKWLGFYYADGRKGGYFSIVNTDPNLILFYLNVLKKLGIQPHQLKARIQISKNYKKIWEHKKLIEWWSKLTNIPEKNFWEIRWVKTKKRYKRNRKPSPETGEIEIAYLNRGFLREVNKKIQEILKTNDKQLIAEFLKGVFAGDGFVKLRKNGKLQEVRIGVKYEKETIYQLLKNVGISPGKPQKFDLPIYGRKNFEIIKELQLLELSHHKLELFLNGLKTLCNGE